MTTLMHEKIQVLLEEDCCHECDGYGDDHVCVHIESMAELPTRFGDFHIVAFSNNRDGKEHIAIVKGDVIGEEDVPVRLHSECLTGDAIGSLRCDCRDQLEAALKKIGEMERGMVLYLRPKMFTDLLDQPEVKLLAEKHRATPILVFDRLGKAGVTFEQFTSQVAVEPIDYPSRRP